MSELYQATDGICRCGRRLIITDQGIVASQKCASTTSQPRNDARSVTRAKILALIGVHGFLLGTALDWSLAYLKAASGFTIVWGAIALVTGIKPVSARTKD